MYEVFFAFHIPLIVNVGSQKSEDNLGSTEAELEKQTNRNADLTRKVRNRSETCIIIIT